MRTILIAAAAAAALSLPGAAFAQATGQAGAPSTDQQTSAPANAPANPNEPGYTTSGPQTTPASDTRVRHHRSKTAKPASANSGDMSAPGESSGSQPTDPNAGQSPQ